MATITRNFIARTLRQCSWLFSTLASGDLTTSFYIPVKGTQAHNVRSNFAGIVNHLTKKDKIFSDEEKRTIQTAWRSRTCVLDKERNSLYFKALTENKIVSIEYDHSSGLLQNTLHEIDAIPTSPVVTYLPQPVFDVIPFHPEVFLAFCTIKQHGAYSKAFYMSLPKEPLPPHDHFGNVAVVIDDQKGMIQIL